MESWIADDKEPEVLTERLIRVENALFYLKAKAKCFTTWDNSEIERLERLRVDLLARCERLHSMATIS